MDGVEPAESLRGWRERTRRVSRSSPAEAGGEAVWLLQLAKLAGPIIIMTLLPAGIKKHSTKNFSQLTWSHIITSH
jgi:hypothetical protein